MAKVASSRRVMTPSELRGEQLKGTRNAGIVAASVKGGSDVDNGLKNFIDTHINDVYPVKKLRHRLYSLKENVKDDLSLEISNDQKNLSVLSKLVSMNPQPPSIENPVACKEVPKDGMAQCSERSHKQCQNTFRTVVELSSAGETFSGLASVDMNKALKGLVAHDKSKGSVVATDEPVFSACFSPEFLVPGLRSPFDLTLKTRMRVAFTSPVNWFHRSVMSSTYNGVPAPTASLGCSADSSVSAELFASQIIGSQVLHSWVYPQSVIPPSVMSVLTSAATGGGGTDFLSKRQLVWENSFRSLYYTLRKSICNIFYVCTPHFVVMFQASNGGSGSTKRRCSAYISRSTRTLRCLLKEHDICFSMPLCHSEVEQPKTEDLLELAEIEKQNLGQSRRSGSSYYVDDSPQSLLALHGNYNVHGLYDLLLNYRSFLTSLSGVDVPLLYSPVPFQNAAISAPQIKCVEMRKADDKHFPSKESTSAPTESKPDSCQALCSSIEIKDGYVPPWIVTRVCALIGSQGTSFEASFSTEHTSVGLNVSLEAAQQKPIPNAEAGKGFEETDFVNGVPEAVLAPQLSSGFLKGLKYSDGSYIASVSPV